MRVRCIAELPSSEQESQLGSFFRAGVQSFGLELGREYLVLGLEVLEGQVWAQFANDIEQVVSAPLFLFDIVDARLSAVWNIRRRSDREVLIWPAAFYTPYFHSDLAEGDAQALSTFRVVKARLEAEDAMR